MMHELALPRTVRIVIVIATATLCASRSAGFEVLTVKDTDYPIPAGAVFVAANGDDGDAGTIGAPLRTIGAAIQQAPANGTIVIRAGVYREGDHVFSKPLTFQPYPHETVWIKGSEVVTSWTPDGPNWRHDGWTHEFDGDSYDEGAIDPAFPYAGLPDLVFVDDAPLAQVGSLGEMSSNTFYVDDGADRLYIGVDPAGRTVEAAAHGRALRAVTSSAHGTVIRGLGFMHYAGHRFAGAVQCDDARTTFENNTVAWSASRGIAIYNVTDAVVRGNTLIYHGQMGLAAWQTHGLIVEGNRLAANNQERFVDHGDVAEASGSKITASHDLTIQGNVIEDNLGTGLWLDVSIHDALIVGNTARTNASFGFFYELSAHAIIAGNVAAGNLDGGIAVSNSSNVRVYNNTLVGNETNLSVFDDARVNGNSEEVALGITWITDDVTLVNNILSNTDAVAPMIFVRDYNSTPLKDADDMIAVSDANAYYRTQASAPSVLAEWWRGTNRIDYPSLAAFQAGTGVEPNGFGLDDIATNPFFVDAANGDYRLVPTSIARDAGAALPADVAAALDLPAGVPVDLGALPYSCVGDLDDNGAVEFGDLLAVIATWGPCVACAADLNGDGDVGMADVFVLIGNWGGCP